LGIEAVKQQFRRMVFNILARNQDDHTKNIAFLMNRSGNWSLSPAFDVMYSWNAQGDWTNQHQMSINGKRDNFTIDDFLACEKNVMLKRGSSREIVREVQEAVARWKEFADTAGISEKKAEEFARGHRQIRI
jgi:serine/threonine-protein kinase HipA